MLIYRNHVFESFIQHVQLNIFPNYLRFQVISGHKITPTIHMEFVFILFFAYSTNLTPDIYKSVVIFQSKKKAFVLVVTQLYLYMTYMVYRSPLSKLSSPHLFTFRRHYIVNKFDISLLGNTSFLSDLKSNWQNLLVTKRTYVMRAWTNRSSFYTRN